MPNTTRAAASNTNWKFAAATKTKLRFLACADGVTAIRTKTGEAALRLLLMRDGHNLIIPRSQGSDKGKRKGQLMLAYLGWII